MKIELFERFRGGIVVSCQAEGDDPFNTPVNVALFAEAARMGGACGIRSEGLAKIAAIKKRVDLPMIGLLKTSFPDGSVRITGSFSEVEALLTLGCDIISIDGTSRFRDGYASGADFIREVKRRYECTVMADISTYDEGLACAEVGADCLSTTLSGYTPYTRIESDLPDVELVRKLVKAVTVPVFAEGRINTPALAKMVLDCGAWGVVVGTAITRPRVITQWFVKTLKNKEI